MGKSININGITLNYEVIGEGEIILFLHGYGLHLDALKYSTEVLFSDKKYKRIYVDLPGMGQSTYTDSLQNSDDILDCILEFINRVIKQEKFSIVGHSYGGYIARGIISRKKKQVKGMALICPVFKANFKERTLPLHKVAYEDTEYFNTLDEETREDLEFLVVRTKRVIDRTMREFFDSESDNEAYLIRIQQNGYAFKEDVDDKVGIFEGQVLFLLGKYDNITGYEDVYDILTHYPNATYHIFNDTGHNLYIEQDELFNQHMTLWLERIT